MIEPFPGEPETQKCPYCAEEIKYKAIYCRYCHSDLTPNKVISTRQPNAYEKRKAESYLSSSKTIWWGGGIFGFLYGLSIAYSLWGFSGMVLSFITGPVFYALFPLYIGFAYGSWWLALINYGTGITAYTLASKAHKLDPSL